MALNFRTIQFLLLLAVAGLLLALPSSAAAKPTFTHALVWSAPKCYGQKKCRDFYPYFHVKDKSGPASRAKICWLGNCRRAVAENCTRCAGGRNMVKVTARYKNVGPYRCGSSTRLTIIYRGITRSKKTKIFCYRA